MNPDIVESIVAFSFENKFPDQVPYIGISVDHIGRIAAKHNISPRIVEIAALGENIIPERYVRNMKSFSIADQAALLQKTACVVGLGGLGGTAVEIFARMGIGRLILIDGDHFEDSNLNRQLLSSPDVRGVPKAAAAQSRVSRINPSVETHCHGEFLDEKNADRLVEGSDVILDCLDNLKTRFLLEKAAKQNKTPLVSGAVAGTTGQVTTIFPEDSGLKSIYGDPAHLPEKGVETALGTLAYTVMMVSTLECAEAVKVLLNRGMPLKNRLLIVNPMENIYEIMKLA